MTKITEIHIARIQILAQHGRITPAAILADAKQTESPLHELYDWDVQRAAEAHWLQRSREILRMVKVVVHLEETSVRIPAYVRDNNSSPKEQGYVSLDTLVLDTTAARRTLIIELGRVVSMLERARKIAIGLDLDQEVNQLLEDVTGLRRVVETQVAQDLTEEIRPQA